MEILTIILWAVLGATLTILVFILPFLYCIDVIGWDDVKQISKWSSIMAVSCGVGLLACYSGNRSQQVEYPASEWGLDYKVTTVNDQSDTTYILTKIR